ncbi:MAG: hypothetical protein ABIR63_08130 [Sphingomicrobium sp.]
MNRPNKTTLALLGGVALLLILLGVFAATRDSDQDKLGDGAGNLIAADNPDLNKACGGQLLYEQIKRALFRQAAQVRGNDQDDYEKIAIAASVRMENAVAEGQSEGLIDCAGSLSIDLPPGVATVAGRHMLMTDIYYGVAQANSGPKKVVQLRNANSLIESLATLTVGARTAAPPQGPQQPMNEPVDDGGSGIPSQAPEPGPPQVPAATAQPSFDCARARSKSEQAICGDPGLAQSDRAMAAEYQRAIASSSPDQAAVLRQTRDRFLTYRDRCANSVCIAEAYNGRVREIRDIMAGRWQPR